MKQFWLRKRHARWNSLEFMKSCLGAEIETRWDVDLFDQKRYKNLTQYVLELRFFWIYSIHHCFRSITCTDLSHLDAFWWQIRSGQGTKWWQRRSKMPWNHDKNMHQHVLWLGFFTIWPTRSHCSSISVTDSFHVRDGFLRGNSRLCMRKRSKSPTLEHPTTTFRVPIWQPKWDYDPIL